MKNLFSKLYKKSETKPDPTVADGLALGSAPFLRKKGGRRVVKTHKSQWGCSCLWHNQEEERELPGLAMEGGDGILRRSPDPTQFL